MARKKISALTELITYAPEDVVPIVQIADGPITKKIKAGNLSQIGRDGWSYLGLNPIYISATSIRFENIDLRPLFPVGTKIKITQTTDKFFYVLSAPFSGGHTTLTVTGGSDFTVANAVITAFWYSHGLAYAFPEMFNFVPTWTVISGTNPTLNNGELYGKFQLVGRLCTITVWVYWGGTTNSGSGNYKFALPIRCLTTPTNLQWVGSCHIRDSGVANYERLCMIATATPDDMRYFQKTTEPNNNSFISNTHPFTFAAGDSISYTITYGIEV